MLTPAKKSTLLLLGVLHGSMDGEAQHAQGTALGFDLQKGNDSLVLAQLAG